MQSCQLDCSDVQAGEGNTLALLAPRRGCATMNAGLVRKRIDVDDDLDYRRRGTVSARHDSRRIADDLLRCVAQAAGWRARVRGGRGVGRIRAGPVWTDNPAAGDGKAGRTAAPGRP